MSHLKVKLPSQSNDRGREVGRYFINPARPIVLLQQHSSLKTINTEGINNYNNIIYITGSEHYISSYTNDKVNLPQNPSFEKSSHFYLTATTGIQLLSTEISADFSLMFQLLHLIIMENDLAQ